MAGSIDLAVECNVGGTVYGIRYYGSRGAYVEMALAQLVINLRYALMSISLSQKVDSNFKTGSRLFYGFL